MKKLSIKKKLFRVNKIRKKEVILTRGTIAVLLSYLILIIKRKGFELEKQYSTFAAS